MNDRVIKKIAAVTSHPIPYQSPIFQAITQQTDMELTVYFGCDYGSNPKRVHPGFNKAFAWDVPLLDGFKYVFLKSSKPDIGVNDWKMDGPEIRSYFKSEGYDAVIVFGWNKMLFWQAIWWAKKYNIPLILRAESNLKHSQSLVRKLTKQFLFPILFKQFKAFMSIGSHNTDLYRHFHVDDRLIHDAPYCVDNKFFAKRAADSGVEARKLRIDLGIPETDTVFLFVAKYVERKRPLDLISAALMNKEHRNFHVILVGGGDLAEECQRMITTNYLENVHLVGFINQNDLPIYYAAADVFVLPSQYETWGLVLNEAMACGLPGIVSDSCGATRDMVLEGQTGYSYPMGDIRQLATLMKRMAESPATCRQMGLRAARHMQNFSVSIVVSALRDILQRIKEK